MTSKEIIQNTDINQVNELRLTPNAIKVSEARYLRKDESGKIAETPQ